MHASYFCVLESKPKGSPTALLHSSLQLIALSWQSLILPFYYKLSFISYQVPVYHFPQLKFHHGFRIPMASLILQASEHRVS